MCWCLCDSGHGRGLSRLGVLWGLLSLATLICAVVTSTWLYTREPVRMPTSHAATTVTFRIGLFRVCPYIKPLNTTTFSPAACTVVKYVEWNDVTHADLGLPAPLEFTPAFLSKMRYAMPFVLLSVGLVLMATMFAVAGHCRNDYKTLIACGLYIIAGLTLGGGLVLFASVLSDVYFERPRRPAMGHDPFRKATSNSSFDYRYGWSYFAAGAAFVMSELAAVLTMSAYLRRFPTVEDMVRAMVPGAERRLREHQGMAGEYLVQHRHKYHRHKPDTSSLSSGLNTRCYSKSDVLMSSDAETADGIDGPLLLSKTAPDICASNPANAVNDDSDVKTCLLDESLEDTKPMNLVGQTVPIVLMHHATLPHKLRPKHNIPSNTGTLPSKSLRSNVSTLETNAFAEHLHKKFNDVEAYEGHMTLNQRFGSALSQLSCGLDSGRGTLSLIHATDPSLPAPSSSAKPLKKKSVTIGSVFSTMDTFEASKVDNDAFGEASAV